MVIITDTASDILENEAWEMGVELVPIVAAFKYEIIEGNTEENFDLFYKKLDEEEEIPVSSQPSPERFYQQYEKAKAQGEDVLVITISSRLSGTYNSALLAKSLADYDRIFVVDSLHASISERMLVEYAVKLRDKKLAVEEIYDQLMEIRTRIYLTGVPADMRFLKKGGRVPPVLANLGDVIGIKPVLWLNNGIIECKSKVRGCKAAKAGMQSFLGEGDLSEELPVFFGHSNNDEKGTGFMEETRVKFNLPTCSLHKVGPAIGTHIGPDALLMAYIVK